MVTLNEDILSKIYNSEIEESSEPKKESMNEEEYKKETDSATKIFGVNSTINATKRAILNAIKAGIESLNTEINLDKYVSTITTSKIGMNLYFDTLYEYPELFYADLSVSCTYYTNSSGAITRFSLKVKYLYNAASVNTMKIYLNNKVKEIKDKYLNNASSLLEKEYIIHDYLLENCTYDTASNVKTISHTAYGALLNSKAVCDGYSKAAKLLFNACGIDSGIVTSDSMNHAWNYVKMNGYYYFLDITWDDPVPETYISRYSYFNRNSNEMVQGNHTWVTGSYPVSTSTVFNFLRSYSKLTRSNDKLYYIDGSNNLYSMTLEGKNKALVKSALPWNSSLGLVGYTNNLYYARPLYYVAEKKTYNVIQRFNITTKATQVVFKTLGQIKKMYKQNETIVIQYTESPNSTTVKTTTISIKIQGDTNRDGIVDSKDVSNLKAKYNKKTGDSGYIAAWDFNKDGIIDIYDIVKVSSKL